MHSIIAILLLLTGNFTEAAQVQPQPDRTKQAFEVASVRHSATCDQNHLPMRTSPGRLTLTCTTLLHLLSISNNPGDEWLKSGGIGIKGGPAWIDKDKFDVVAKAEGLPPKALMEGTMLQSLIEERFAVKYHRETVEAPVYQLTLMRDILQPTKTDSCAVSDPDAKPGPPPKGSRYCGGPYVSPDGTLWKVDYYGTTMDYFASLLRMFTGRRVINKTGLAGRYDIEFKVVPPASGPGGAVILNGQPHVDEAGPPPEETADGPTIFAAVRALGLKLVPAKATFPVIVVDDAKQPVEN